MRESSPFNYKRRTTTVATAGNVTIGGNAPIRVQSMTNTNTNDIEASAAQCQRIAQAGGELVRLTAQGVREAQSIGEIKQRLIEQGCDVPLVADIHFNPRAAIAAAQVTDKVRINPGNFVDPARQFKRLDYTDEEYALELTKLRETLVPFLELCRERGTAVRLGVNHGSLSDRIMSRYGNTAAGMVESVMEFLRVAVEVNFTNIVISMKASNVVVMVEAVRRLVDAMDREDMHFPLHLGVTEAGFGEDGRVKSAVGIGTLLSEGLGDTIRVSLSEDPELEIPVARKLVEHVTAREGHAPIEGGYAPGYEPLSPMRRTTTSVDGLVGARHVPIVVSSCAPDNLGDVPQPDFYFSLVGALNDKDRFIVPAQSYEGTPNTFPLFSLNDLDLNCPATIKWLGVNTTSAPEQLIPFAERNDIVVVLFSNHINIPGDIQAYVHRMESLGIKLPVVARTIYSESDVEWLQVKAGVDLGTVVMNGRADGVWLDAPEQRPDIVVGTAFTILQAARQRITHTEFISCPSCGRTMFDLQTTVQQVKAATAHLTHLKIGVMGCVVNGPGEMADADYGYVGAAVGRISLYKGKECIEKNIPQEQAIDRLVELIKAHGDWCDPGKM
ncbi:MAG: (E)-4-hydroxy-3-methylbut-2-enyl-diphosphate synthase [Muribaculaceae bacterium]|nr:(E)-4-hydroxy-3-methylbut-2-enyl-diphosphate synthase [Muribaculaceae bacterium]